MNNTRVVTVIASLVAGLMTFASVVDVIDENVSIYTGLRVFVALVFGFIAVVSIRSRMQEK